MDKKHLQTFSTSLVIREMQVKTILRFYFTLVRMAKIKNSCNLLTRMLTRMWKKRNTPKLLVGLKAVKINLLVP